MIRRLDDVQVVFDDQHRIALVDQAVQDLQQPFNVVGMQPGRGFVQDVKVFPVLLLVQFGSQLHPLCFPTGQGRGGLPQLDVPQTNVLDGLQFAGDLGDSVEELQGFADRHVQDVGDVLPLVFDFQGFGIVPRPVADFTRHINVG